jgi:phage terminase large subunit-like protein
MGAGLCNYALVGDGVAGAQCFTAARTAAHAMTPFRDCKRVLGPELRARLSVLEHNIGDPASGGFIRPVSSEAQNLEGHRVHFAFMDEVGQHKDGEVIKSMRRGVKGNRNSLLFMITNSGESRESICWEYHDKTRKVLEGTIDDDELFGYVCQLDPCRACRKAGHETPQQGCPECDDWRDEKTWPKTIPSSLHSVLRYNFCVWLSNADRWFTPDQWASCGSPPADMIGRPAILGVDMANTKDLAALVLIAPSADFFSETQIDDQGRLVISEVRGHVDVRCWTWCPEAMVEEQSKRGIPYDMWVRDGVLFATEGNTIDRRLIRQFVVGLREAGYWIEEIAYDIAFANEFAQELQDQHGFTVVPITQDVRNLTEPCMLLETLVARQQLRHGNAPLLRFAAANALVERDAGGRMRPSKKKSAPNGKIDPISALVTGLKRLSILQGIGTTPQEAFLGPPRETSRIPW